MLGALGGRRDGVMNAPQSAPPEQILVVRHGEKPALLGGPAGIKENGTEDHHSLTVRGWQRAGALAPFFGTPLHPAVRRPTTLFAPPEAGHDGDHGRPYQTIVPLAARLGLTIDDRHCLDEEAELVADVRARAGVVLIAWEHKRIPRIADAILGDHATAPRAWPDDRFDLVWVFDRDAAGGYRFSQLPQLLLGGDRPDIVPAG
jgi:broad specificity phosphatase PhoE